MQRRPKNLGRDCPLELEANMKLRIHRVTPQGRDSRGCTLEHQPSLSGKTSVNTPKHSSEALVALKYFGLGIP